MLRVHIARYGTGPGGHLFRTARGGPLNDTGYGEVRQRVPTQGTHPSPAGIAAGPPTLRPAARRGVAVAERRTWPASWATPLRPQGDRHLSCASGTGVSSATVAARERSSARSILVIIWHLLVDPDAQFHDLGPGLLRRPHRP